VGAEGNAPPKGTPPEETCMQQAYTE